MPLPQAMKDAGTGGVVYLRAGLHTENTRLLISSSTILIGEDGAILKVKTPVSVPDTDGIIPLNPAIYVLNASNTAVGNISIQPLDADGSTGILFENSAMSASMRNNLNNFQFSVVFEKSDNPVAIGNKIVGSTLSARGGIPLELGILVMNGKSAWIAQNEVSGNLHGLFLCDKYGTATQNYLHDNVFGLNLCTIGGLKLPGGQYGGGLSAATNWKITGNRSENNAASGYLVIDNSTDNLLQNNTSAGNGAYDIELSGATSRFGFPAASSFNTTVFAGATQKVKDCGSGNKVTGGILDITTPCK